MSKFVIFSRAILYIDKTWNASNTFNTKWVKKSPIESRFKLPVRTTDSSPLPSTYMYDRDRHFQFWFGISFSTPFLQIFKFSLKRFQKSLWKYKNDLTSNKLIKSRNRRKKKENLNMKETKQNKNEKIY